MRREPWEHPGNKVGNTTSTLGTPPYRREMSQGRLGIGWEHPWDKPASGPGGPEGAPPRTSGKARRVLTSNRGTRIGAAKPSGSPGWERPTKENPFVFRKRLDELDLWALSEWETAQGEPR